MGHSYEPKDCTPPGETLRETMVAKAFTPAELARQTGLPLDEIRQLLTSKISITPEAATRLESALGVPAVFWRTLDANFRCMVSTIK